MTTSSVSAELQHEKPTNNSRIITLIARVALLVVPPVVLLVLDLVLNKTSLEGWDIALWTILLAGLGWVVGQQLEIERRIVMTDEERKEDRAESTAALQQMLEERERERAGVLEDHQERMDLLLASGSANFRAHGSMTGIAAHYASIIHDAAKTGFDKDVKVLFAQRLLHDTDQAMKLLVEEQRYQVEVRSPSNQYSNRWVEMLDSMIGEKGVFKTVTNAVVWSEDHLGFQQGSSPYLNKQVQAAKSNGFACKRLFVVPDEDALRNDPGLAMTLESLFRQYLNAGGAAGPRMEGRVLEVTRNSYMNHFSKPPKDVQDSIPSGWSSNFAVWWSEGPKTVNLVRYYVDPTAPMDPAIEAICFLCSEHVAQRFSEYFDHLWDKPSIELSTYHDRLARKLPHSKASTDLVESEAAQANAAVEPVREFVPRPKPGSSPSAAPVAEASQERGDGQS